MAEDSKEGLQKSEYKSDNLRSEAKLQFRNEMMDMLSQENEVDNIDFNDESAMESYIKNLNLNNNQSNQEVSNDTSSKYQQLSSKNEENVAKESSDETVGVGIPNKSMDQEYDFKIPSKTIDQHTSSDHSVEKNESSEDDEFIVHSAEEAIRRMSTMEGIKRKNRDDEDIFTALFGWCATDREEEDM